MPLKKEKTVDRFLCWNLSWVLCLEGVMLLFLMNDSIVSKILDQNNYLHIIFHIWYEHKYVCVSLWWNDRVVIPLQNKHQFLRKSKLWLFSPKWVQQIFTLRQIFELDCAENCWLCASHYICFTRLLTVIKNVHWFWQLQEVSFHQAFLSKMWSYSHSACMWLWFLVDCVCLGLVRIKMLEGDWMFAALSSSNFVSG